MKRPLFAAAVILVAAVWAGLAAGVYPLPGRIGTGREMELEQEVPWYVTGQVCRKEEDKIWIQSVIIDESNPYAEKLICELAEEGRNIPLGSKVSVKGIFASFRAAGNPGEFDKAAYYRSMGAGGQLKKARVLEIGGEYWRVREALYQLRLHFKRRLYQVFPEREATVMCALLLGEKGDIDSGIKELYKRNGILHILSISSPNTHFWSYLFPQNPCISKTFKGRYIVRYPPDEAFWVNCHSRG